MKSTLSVTKISYAHGYADVTTCEVAPDGSRDGFESHRLTFDALASEDEAKADVDAQLKAIASERGLNY
jgi:hypothetical protein